MTILATDIKLLESEVMADTTDGGGRRTSRVIPDGVAGNIFPKVSRLDSVYGRVNLRKVYGTVQTANVDTYAGSHVVITDAPDNEKIHCTLFSTASEFDTRDSARDRIESYVTSGPESRMILLGRQLPGQQTFLTYQRTEEPLPEIGDVYCLSNEPGSVVTTQQYVRIADIDHEVRTFTEIIGSPIDFQRRVLTIDVGVPLRYEFRGPDAPSMSSNVARNARVRNTTVVDAARYFGIKALAEAADANDLTVRVESVYTPIVPTTNRETPISNENISDAVAILAAGAAISENLSWGGAGQVRYASRSIVPGSLSIAGVTDDRQGVITGTGFVGLVNYETGAITRNGGSAGWGGLTITYTPGASASQPAQTMDLPVDLNTRGTIYSLTLNPLPAPGSVIVDYRALGKWYRLRDDGAGKLAGTDAAYGIGDITYSTGALVLTLGALPDVDSSVLVSFGSPAHYAIRAGGTADAGTSMRQSFTLPDLPVSPDSFSLTYTSGGVQYTATDNAGGVISGNGIAGNINYTTGLVDLDYTTRMPDSNTVVGCAYNQIVPTNQADIVARSLSQSAGASVALGTPVVAGSFNGTIPFSGGIVHGNVYVRDNGAGLLLAVGGQILRTDNSRAKDAVIVAEQTIGTINYSTGALAINQSILAQYSSYQATSFTYPNGPGGGTLATGWGWEAKEDTLAISAGTANYGWKDSGVASAVVAKTSDATFNAAPLRVDLLRTVSDRVVQGSLMFAIGGKTYIDRNGTLYTDVSTNNGSGVVAGTVNYATGVVSLSNWNSGSALSMAVAACLTIYGNPSGFEFQFRTPGSPIRPGSLYIQATTEDGMLLSATSNENGVIAGARVSGTVNQETGVVRLKFGQMVTAAGHESEWWYSAAGVTGGQIFKPDMIVANSLTYNCVVLANLPLNADILGLDPVRLPLDGRVPIYRPADVVLIHHTGDTGLTNPVTAGATYSAGRTNLAELWLVDATGIKLSASQYAVDLIAGTVTMAADFTAGALVQPLHAKHRIEDMGLLADVQINGQLTLGAALSRNYPLGSFVSSALLFGDMNARVTGVHDLLAFSAWSDTPGAGANAQYNNIDYPIEVLNNGAVNERWRINFTSTTAFQVIGENLGVIATGSIGVDCSPANQLTGQPYFVIRAAGWGGGWAAGNQLRFNSLSAAAPIWIARTVLPGATLEGDSFSMQVRGDVDAE